jgi:hypothetical protein
MQTIISKIRASGIWMDKFRPIVILTARGALGFLLAMVLSMVGLGTGWGFFVFFGATTLATLLIMLMAGAGIGAGLGVFVAWLRLDGDTRRNLILTLLLAMVAGIGGAWLGYQYGGVQETECCAMPDKNPIIYTAFGATIVANTVIILATIGREVFTKRMGRQLF